MIYSIALKLQQAVYTQLSLDEDLISVLGEGRIFDDPPTVLQTKGTLFPYVVIGDDTLKHWGSSDKPGVEYKLEISVYSEYRGFTNVKTIASSVVQSMLKMGGLYYGSLLVIDINFTKGAAIRNVKDNIRSVLLEFTGHAELADV